MIIVVDSGSTKARWVWMSQGARSETVTQGLNPRLTDDETMRAVFAQVRQQLPEAVEALYFYGAGCGTDAVQQRMRELLAVAFDKALISVEGDLLGACRAASGNMAGLVGIVGTGSNLCYYDGRKIARQRVSTGFILGDEGSGNHVGRRLLKDYLEERMPKRVSDLFHDEYGYTTDQFIDRIYRQPYPNRFLASLVPFAARHREEEYISQVLEECFGAFFGQIDYFEDYRQLPLHLVGGMTATFELELRLAAAHRGIILGQLVPDPSGPLLHYHLERQPEQAGKSFFRG